MPDKTPTITYTDDGSNNGNGTFSVDVNPIVMQGPGNIIFTLAFGPNTSGWAFATSDVAFGLDVIPAENPFSFTILNNGKLKVVDDNDESTDGVAYQYYVQIQKGTTVRRYDPVIDNDPPSIWRTQPAPKPAEENV